VSDTPLSSFLSKEAKHFMPNMYVVPAFALEQLERENAALREERDSYRFRSEQIWGLRKEIQSALNVSFDCEGEEALKRGLAAIKTLRADKERLDWLEKQCVFMNLEHSPGVYSRFLTTRDEIDAARKDAQP
jgi:hypothetical protein